MKIAALIKSLFTNATLVNFAWRSIQIFVKQGLPFIIFGICAKFLTPAEFGLYNYVLAATFLLALFGDFGISTATSRFVTEYHSVSSPKLKLVFFNATLAISALTALVLIPTLIFGRLYFKETYPLLILVLPVAFLSPMTSLLDGVYRGLRQFKLLATISILASIITLPVVFLLIANLGLKGALLSQSIFYLILLAGLGIRLGSFTWKFDHSVFIEISKYSLTYGVAVFGNYLFIRSGLLVLGHYDYFSQIAAYELLNKLFMILLLPFILFGQVIAPDFTEMNMKGQYAEIYEQLHKYTIWLLLIGSFLGYLFYILIPCLLGIFLPKYLNPDLFNILPYAALMYAMNVWAATIDFGILVPTGHARLMANLFIVLGVLGTILSIVLLHFFGYMGVIYSFTVSTLAMVIGLRVMFYKTIKHKLSASLSE